MRKTTRRTPKQRKTIPRKKTGIGKYKERPFNNGTMTHSEFFSFLRSALRAKSRWWKPILQTKNESRIPYTGTNKRRKWSYICNRCGNAYDSKNVSVHHKIECGSLTSFEDLPEFCRRLFCEKDGLELLCDGCHAKEHKK